MRAIGFQLRAELRVRWRSWLVLALLAGLLGGVLAATLACARRTDSVVARYRRSSLATDVIVGNGGNFGNQGLDLARVRRLPQVVASHRGVLLAARVRSRAGADVSQVGATVAWHATTIAVVAVAVGLPIGVAAGRWAWNFVAEHLGVVPEVVTPIPATLMVVPAVLLLVNVAAAVPARFAARTPPTVVLRAE